MIVLKRKAKINLQKEIVAAYAESIVLSQMTRFQIRMEVDARKFDDRIVVELHYRDTIAEKHFMLGCGPDDNALVVSDKVEETRETYFLKHAGQHIKEVIQISKEDWNEPDPPADPNDDVLFPVEAMD